MTGVVYFVQNPSDPAQAYALWDTGRIDPFGGALPIFDGPEWYNTPYLPGRALYISDWDGPSGFVLDTWGGFHAFGAESPPGTGEYDYIMPTVPYTGGITGVQNPGPSKYVDWEWDPDNNGQGYVCDYWGQLYEFGGALACPRVGPRYASPVVRRFTMQFAPLKRSVMVDFGGSRNQDFPAKQLALDGYYDASRDWVRWAIITDWGSASPVVDPSGYTLLASAIVHEWGPNKPQDAFGFFVGDQGTQVALGLINPPNPLTLATGPADPLTLVQVAAGGQLTQYTASTAPTVLAGGASGTPAAVVIDTTRPWLMWSYSDPQSDSQQKYQLIVWPQSWVDTHTMTNPLLERGSATAFIEGTDSTIRGVICPVDLANGAYRMYVRAQDTSERYSQWSNRGWMQTVPTPAAPTGLLATVDEFHVNLVLTVASVEPGQLAVFESSDDAGLTWQAVRGAEAVKLALTTYAVDWDIPLGLPRSYRARLFYDVPRTISDPSPLRTVTVERYTFALTSTSDPSLGGEVFPVGAMRWDREQSAGVHEPMGAEFPIVISDEKPKSRRRTLTLDSETRERWDRIAALASSGHVLLLREPFGEVGYYKLVGSWGRDQVRALSHPDSGPALAHVHEVPLPLVEVARPVPVPAETV